MAVTWDLKVEMIIELRETLPGADRPPFDAGSCEPRFKPGLRAAAEAASAFRWRSIKYSNINMLYDYRAIETLFGSR